MNNYFPIEAVAAQLTNDYDWSHSFIRECYFTTGRNLKEFYDSSQTAFLGDTDGPQNVRLIVACAGNPLNTGIEFMLRDIGVFLIQRLHELSFDYKSDKHAGHIVTFGGPLDEEHACFFTAKSVLIKFLGRTYQGPQLRLGGEMPSEEAPIAIRLDGCWRQCPICGNAWEERPTVDFSRCPKCGELSQTT
jgi:hypothetical protein